MAFAIYSCVQGTCARQCLSDATCGGTGFICKQSGVCARADCTTKADCPASQYCTSATNGRCLAFQTCASASDCSAHEACKRFDPGQCPPGFDCTLLVCQERQRCFVDADCAGTSSSTTPQICRENHCYPTATCTAATDCPDAGDCVAKKCVPSVCRGAGDCPTGQHCTDGTCVPVPVVGDINALAITPPNAVLEVGDTLDVHLMGVRLDGTAIPLTSGVFSVVDSQGQPSTLASINSQGHLLAQAPGTARVAATVSGASVGTQYVDLVIYPAVSTGRRVVVIDAATRSPVPGATVRGCASAVCVSPETVLTDPTGAAAFTTLSALADFTVIAPQTRPGDGLPRYERITVMGTQVTSLLIPLSANPVESAAGISATIAFNDVHSNGNYWAGFSAVSLSDPTLFAPSALLGDNFWTELPGTGQRVPIPASVTLLTSLGFGFTQDIKPKSLSQGEPGTRRAVAFAGRASQSEALTLRSIDLLGYLGAFDFDTSPRLSLSANPNVPDTSDVDGDGLCSDSMRCPMGPEKVPDYAHFTPTAFTPRREQSMRTEVQVAPLPGPFDRVMVAAVAAEADTGLLPLGLTAKNATGMSGAGRTVDAFVLRNGAPYGDLSLAALGIFAVAQTADDTSQSGRLSLGTRLPTKVWLKPFLPALAAPGYSSVDRTLRPAQPGWAAASSAGANWARLTLKGSQTIHRYYFAHSGTQTELALPAVPPGLGIDPSQEPVASTALCAIELVDGVSADDVLSFNGINLLSWGRAIDGYSSFGR